MSKYQKEYGSFKIPSAEFVELKRKIIDAYNKHQDNTFDFAQTLHGVLVQSKLKAEGSDLPFDPLFDKAVETVKSRLDISAVRGVDIYGDVTRSLCDEDDVQLRLRRPLKQDFPYIPISAQRCFIEFTPGAHISFDQDNKAVSWEVDENNHAVDEARNHPVANVFFKALNSVQWTRGTGGMIHYTDEYMRDAFGSGGDTSRISSRFGPIGEEGAFPVAPVAKTKPGMR
jgi:hypothetical protein